jgi:hypothetical protein
MSRRRPPTLEDAAPAVILTMPEAEAPDLAAPVDGARPELEDVLEDGAPEDEADEDEDGAEVIDLAARRPPAGAPGAEDEDAPEGGARRVPDAAEVARLMREWGIDKWRARVAWERMNPEPDDSGRAPVECPERIAVLPRARPPAKGRPAWSAERTPDNLRAVFELRPWRERLRWDAFNLRADLRGAHPDAPWTPWGDGDALNLRADLCADLGPDWGADDVRGYAAGAARLTEWHPVREYLRGLRWDGAPRIWSWVPRFYGAPDTDLFREIGARWLIGAVARVMRPGCKMDTVLTLAGPQGSGKSRSLEALAGGWFSDSPLPIGDKDGAQTIVGTWIWELAELSDVQKKTFETVKAFLSSATDRYRPSYGRRGDVESVPRQTVFCATVNPEEGSRFLRDRTGNRRFWYVPVDRTKTAQVDVPALEDERDQLWAEALAMFDAGERWHLPAGLETELEGAQEAAQGESDAWTSLVTGWLHTEAPPFFTTAEAAKLAVGLENARLGHNDAGRLVFCLAKAGCKSVNRRRGGVQVKGWAWDRPEAAADEGTP